MSSPRRVTRYQDKYGNYFRTKKEAEDWQAYQDSQEEYQAIQRAEKHIDIDTVINISGNNSLWLFPKTEKELDIIINYYTGAKVIKHGTPKINNWLCSFLDEDSDYHVCTLSHIKDQVKKLEKQLNGNNKS